jgi:hypothetical protein
VAVAIIGLMLSSAAAGQQITTENEQVLLEGEANTVEKVAAVLAPGARTMLFTVPPLETAKTSEGPHKLYLYDFSSSARVELAIGAFDLSMSYPLRYNSVFSADGSVCLLPDLRAGDVATNDFVRPLLVCDLSNGRLINTVYATNINTQQIDSSGEYLIGVDGKAYPLRSSVARGRRGTSARSGAAAPTTGRATGAVRVSRPNTRPSNLTVITSPLGVYTPGRGQLLAVSPTGMVAAYGTTHYAANSLRQGSSARMVLWDLSTNQQVAAMPVMPDSDAQDKAVTAFTPDGKYLIYGDGKAGTGKGRVLRVYDIAAKRNIAEIPGKSVAGRGPTPGSVYLRTSSGEPAIVRYDAASNTSTPVALPQRSIKCIGGDKIGYVRSEEGRGFFCIADLVSTP